MEVVDRYLLATVFRETPELVFGVANDVLSGFAKLLPGQSGDTLRAVAQRCFGGLAGWVGRSLRAAAARSANFVYPPPRPTVAATEPEPVNRDRSRSRVGTTFEE